MPSMKDMIIVEMSRAQPNQEGVMPIPPVAEKGKFRKIEGAEQEVTAKMDLAKADIDPKK